MSLPNVNITVADGGIGVTEGTVSGYVLIGTCTSGTIAAENSITDVNDAKTTLGQGPLAELAATVTQIAGGPVTAIRCSGSVGANKTAVSQDGTGPAIFLSGSAYDSYEFRVKIVRGGGIGTGSFQYSLDDGRNYSPELTIPSGQQFLSALKRDTGLEIGFNDGTFVAGEQYTATTEAPHWNTSDIAEAMSTVSGSATTFSIVALAGMPVSASTASTNFSAVDTHMTNLENSKVYSVAIMDFGSRDTVANVVSQAAGVSSKRISPVYGQADMTTSKPFPGYGKPKTPVLNAYVARVLSSLVSTPAGRVASGPLPGVDALTLTHNETREQSIDQQAHVATAGTIKGYSGAFIIRGRIKSNDGSDFNEISRRRVIDLACQTAYSALVQFVNSTVRTNPDGTIDPRDAARIETDVERKLRAALTSPKNAEGTGGHCSSFTFSVDTTNNVASTSTLLSTLSIVPLGIAETIDITIGYQIDDPAAV